MTDPSLRDRSPPDARSHAQGERGDSTLSDNTRAKRIRVVGLSGAPAAGKSTVAAMFADAGCAIIDVDALGHQVLATDVLRGAVVAEFGNAVLGADQQLDRAALARIAFRDDAAIARLEALVHPAVRRRLTADVAAARTCAPRAIVIDAALLFESGLDALCDVTVVVSASERVRVERAQSTRGWSDGELERRQARQLAPAQKRQRADRILENDGSREDLGARTLALLDELVPHTEAESTPT